jgi:hypothetical protein
MINFLHFLRLLSLLLLCLPASAQSLSAIDSVSIFPNHVYVLLQDSIFPIHHIQAKTAPDNRSEERSITLEIYNLLLPATTVNRLVTSSDIFLQKSDSLLITLSILPDSQGNINWRLINLDTISSKYHTSLRKVIQDGAKRLAVYTRMGRPQDHLIVSRTNLRPIVKRQGQYWTPIDDVFTEYFLIRSRKISDLSQADYMTINIKGPMVAYDAPYRTLRSLLPLGISYTYTHTLPMGIVLSSKHNGIYQFWSRAQATPLHVPGLHYYGNEIFEYKPGIGIISGSYHSYYYSASNVELPAFFKNVLLDGNNRLR